MLDQKGRIRICTSTRGISYEKENLEKILDGSKVQYRCNGGKYRKMRCPAGLHLLYHYSTSSKVSLFTTECDHDNHDLVTSRGLETEDIYSCKIWRRYYETKCYFGCYIRKRNITELPKSKIVTYLKQLRSEKYGLPTISGTEITEWCKAREKILIEKDIPFVLKHTIEWESFDPDEQDIKIVISTLRLLEKKIQIDATYKIIWQVYPVMVFSTTDQDQVFHPFVIAVCKRDFGVIFEALHKLILFGSRFY